MQGSVEIHSEQAVATIITVNRTRMPLKANNIQGRQIFVVTR